MVGASGTLRSRPEINAAWFADIAAVEAALVAFIGRERPRTALETRERHRPLHALHRAARGQLTAVDASPEAHRDQPRAACGAPTSSYVEADLFAWTPPARVRPRVDELLAVARAGRALRCVLGDRCARAGRRRVRVRHRFGVRSDIDARRSPDAGPRAGVVARKLNDGRDFRVVKVFHEPEALHARLAALGFDARSRAGRRATSSTAAVRAAKPGRAAFDRRGAARRARRQSVW